AAAGPYSLDRRAIDGRRLKNAALAYLTSTGRPEAIAWARRQFESADNMTDIQAALTCLVDTEGPEREQALDAFYRRWKSDPLVLDKWFSVQALSRRPDTLDRVIELSRHPDFNFKNPNRVRALLGVFSVRNQVRFHAADGRGYAFLADAILRLDAINPQVAARLVGAFGQWRRFDPGRRRHMHEHLARIVSHPKLSRDVYELASKSLGES